VVRLWPVALMSAAIWSRPMAYIETAELDIGCSPWFVMGC
jgi:hypothetical protein